MAVLLLFTLQLAVNTMKAFLRFAFLCLSLTRAGAVLCRLTPSNSDSFWSGMKVVGPGNVLSPLKLQILGTQRLFAKGFPPGLFKV